MNKDTYILAIESSCDDTGVAIVKNGREVISNAISSQIDIHTLYGGVVPEIASRNHAVNISGVCKEALKRANMTIDDMDAIAVTYGAGLLGALIVGVNFAKGLAYSHHKPLIGVNHIEGHIAANYIAFKELNLPFLCLIVSGGHTALVEITESSDRKLIGTTTDDAVGEAFDKVARVLGLPYPGGPSVQAHAKNGKSDIEFIKLHKSNDFNFSYSGIKTAVVNYVHNIEQRGEKVPVDDICASFQKQAVEMLVTKTIMAAEKFGYKKIVLAGGVSANAALREAMTQAGEKIGAKVYYPELSLCTDNAAMIGAAGYIGFKNGKGIISPLKIVPSSTIKL